MGMRKSRVLKKLRAGENVSCIKINLADPRVCEMAALAGFDCAWVDQEHISQDWSALEASVWATKAHDTDILVRVPRGAYNNYIKPLEIDATGMMDILREMTDLIIRSGGGSVINISSMMRMFAPIMQD